MLDILNMVKAVFKSTDALWNPEGWQSLYIDYEQPLVERLWRQWGDFRVYLHTIYPCTLAFYHPHNWPSAMEVLKGSYEMRVGYDDLADDRNEEGVDRALWDLPNFSSPPPVACVLKLAAGSQYEMVDRGSWHSVNPIDEPAYSLMVTGKPFPGHKIHPKKAMRPLDDETKERQLKIFRSLLG